MRLFEVSIPASFMSNYGGIVNAAVVVLVFALYAFLLYCAYRLSSWFRRLSEESARRASPPKTEEEKKPSSWRHTMGRFAPPPVLGMLLVGVVARFVLDYTVEDPDVVAKREERTQTVTLFRSSSVIETILKLCQPCFNLSLGCIALEIGSHLNYHHLARVKRPLLMFLLCFIPVVYFGMLFWFRFVSDVVLQPVTVENRLRTLLFMAEQKEWDRLTDAAPAINNTMTNTTVDTTMRKKVKFDYYHLSPIAEHFVDVHHYYIQRTIWCFTVLLATITLERSSPEFLSSMSFTGVTEGFLPVFTLCVTACQDVMGLLLFVILSLLLQPVQEDNMYFFQKNVNLLQQFWRQSVENHFRHAQEQSETIYPNEYRWKNYRPERRTVLDILKGGGSAVLLLCIIFLSTAVASITTILLRKGLMRVLATESKPEEDTTNTEQPAAGPRVGYTLHRAVLMLLLLSGTLSLFSTYTHTELLLAAVLAGSVINFYQTCPVLESAMVATRPLNNVVLFTTAGLRVSLFSSSAASSSSTLLLYIRWGMFLFACKVAFCYLGANMGSLVAGVPMLVKEELEVAVHKDAEAPVEEGEGGDAPQWETSPVKIDMQLIYSVCRYIGLGLLTQLAISLTLNLRAKDEYNALLQQVFEFDFSATPASRPLSTTIENEVQWPDMLVPMLPLTQTFIFYIISSIVVGPLLGVRVLNHYRRVQPPTAQ
ncbi:hypothetical protein AGDE_14557 [Angomonas deanei]|uniref:Uncharacterized protein n=1 Tax=Angomonas deanei TaxID=59799 RepID=A0A7G2C256_9TRYP|nr:hypothetical protein AGDE_14557 [Angomonas deanei]CAD2212787.1 hypothetical protein, conserved [Angomonas deanei]|eukprot:EPY20636.1 hypothetical protein AGDE_14557 [Angomonas deanei]